VVETVLLKRLYVLVFIELNVERHDAGLAFSHDGACGSTPPCHAVSSRISGLGHKIVMVDLYRAYGTTLLVSSPDVE
jgi:hypothetical protein